MSLHSLACLLVVCNIRCCSLKLIWDLCCNMQWSYTQHWWDVGVSKIISYITESWFSWFCLYSNQWLPCLFWSHVWGPTVSRAKCWHSKISGGPARGPPEPEKTWSLQAYEKSWGVLKLTYYDKSRLFIEPMKYNDFLVCFSTSLFLKARKQVVFHWFYNQNSSSCKVIVNEVDLLRWDADLLR